MKSTSTTQEDYGQLGIIILFLREYRKGHTQKVLPKKGILSGRRGNRHSGIQKRSGGKKNDSTEEDLATIPKKKHRERGPGKWCTD